MANRGLTKINKKKINNPFIREKTNKRFKKKCRIICFSLFIFIALFIYLMLFSGVFTIREIEVDGLRKVESSEIENVVKDQINSSRVLFFSEKNLILFNKTKIVKSLEDYNFSKIIVKKALFGTLRLEIEEREAAYILKENKNYYLLDVSGNIISTHSLCEDEEIVISEELGKNQDITEELGADLDTYESNVSTGGQGFQKNECIESISDFLHDNKLPLIENDSSSRLDRDLKYAKISKEYLDFALKLYDDLGIETDFRVKNFIIDESVNTIKVRLFNDILVFFSLKDDYNDQRENFLSLKKEYKENLRGVEYIDIRYGDKIYYH